MLKLVFEYVKVQKLAKRKGRRRGGGGGGWGRAGEGKSGAGEYREDLRECCHSGNFTFPWQPFYHVAV